jgi:DHA1 family multidrug resistance protein-like MFS transporter
LLGFVEGAFALGVAGVLCGLGHGMANPILNGLVVNRARPAELGAAMSAYTAVFDAGALLGPPVLGIIVRSFGYPAMFGVSSAMVFVGLAVFAVWDRGR